MPQGQVKEWIVAFVKEQLVELMHHEQNISKVQVVFKGHTNGGNSLKICEITLTVDGAVIFVHKTAESYEQAARWAIAAIGERVHHPHAV